MCKIINLLILKPQINDRLKNIDKNMKWEELNTKRYYEYINNIIKTRGQHYIINDY